MRWWVFFLALLVVPSASALSITGCPSTVMAGQSFTVTVSQSGAAYVGVDNGAGITDSAQASSALLSTHIDTPDPNQQVFPAYKNSGDTQWRYDTSVFCYVDVTAADHPASVPIQGSTHSTSIDSSFWVESYGATDADGIYQLVLSRSWNGGAFAQVYPVKFCNSQTSCSNTWYRSESQPGTYNYQVKLTDTLTNTYDSQAWTVSVTDPCDGSSCGVCTDYSWACVSYTGGSLCNPQNPTQCYDPDQHCTKTYAQAGKPCVSEGGASGTCDGAGTCVPDCQYAPEFCNGLDDNCDGLIDNQVTDCVFLRKVTGIPRESDQCSWGR